MSVYGVGLLVACLVTGTFIGEAIGRLMGIDANVVARQRI